MVKKLLQVYENRILNERSKGRLGVLGWGYIIANLVLFILFFVCQLMHWYWGGSMANVYISGGLNNFYNNYK